MTTSLKILVVDDDVDNACSLGELLEMEGHHVKVVHSGEDALKAAHEDDFNISFMDVVLPGMNGVESFLQIRRVRPMARVYMMTGYSVEQLLTQALDGGALGVLEKPFDPESILSLTAKIGPAGLVVAPPSDAQHNLDVGKFIRSTLTDNGVRCRHVVSLDDMPRHIDGGDVLLLDMPTPLIEGMDAFKAAQASGHRGRTVLIPHARTMVASTTAPFADVSLTGILNKPFDPLELINKLPHLAA